MNLANTNSKYCFRLDKCLIILRTNDLIICIIITLSNNLEKKLRYLYKGSHRISSKQPIESPVIMFMNWYSCIRSQFSLRLTCWPPLDCKMPWMFTWMVWEYAKDKVNWTKEYWEFPHNTDKNRANFDEITPRKCQYLETWRWFTVENVDFDYVMVINKKSFVINIYSTASDILLFCKWSRYV